MAFETEKAKVYFVDDEPDILEVCEMTFSLHFDVKTFSSPVACIDYIKSHPEDRPELIVTDLRMAEMSGIEMLTQLKAINLEVPAIMLSGNIDKDAAVAAANIGFYKILEKPLNFSLIRMNIEQLLVEKEIHDVRLEVRELMQKVRLVYKNIRKLCEENVPNFQSTLEGSVDADRTLNELEEKLDILLETERQYEQMRMHRTR